MVDICGIHPINVRVAIVLRRLSCFILLSINIHLSDTSLSHNTLTTEAFKKAIADNHCLGKEWLKIEELNAKLLGAVLDLGY